MRLLLIFATGLEAKPWMSEDQQKEWFTPGSSFFKGSKVDILITGIGPVITANALGRISHHNYDMWINFGIVGALSHNMTIGSIYEVGEVKLLGNTHPFNPEFDLIKIGDGTRLLTVTEAVHDAQLKEQLSQESDLVDMEGYGIALAAKMANIPLRIFKIVSDLSDKKDSKDILKRLPELIKKLYSEVSIPPQ